MENHLKTNLEAICKRFTDKLESITINAPIGTCYLIGHCLAEGLRRGGYTAREVSGTAIFKDKSGKNIIYGKSKLKGAKIGLYHTWCVVEINNRTILLDPSYKYNKIAIKEHYGIKPNKNIPDIIVTDNPIQWNYIFVEDKPAIRISKRDLKRTDESIINALIDEVESATLAFLKPNLNLA